MKYSIDSAPTALLSIWILCALLIIKLSQLCLVHLAGFQCLAMRYRANMPMSIMIIVRMLYGVFGGDVFPVTRPVIWSFVPVFCVSVLLIVVLVS